MTKITATFCDVTVEATVNGHTIIGRVNFPYALPDGQRCAFIDATLCNKRTENTSSRRTEQQREEAVAMYRSLITDTGRDRTRAADLVAHSYNVSRRTIQLWVRDSELATDHSPLATSAFPDDETLRSAMLICGWWSFRIANLPTINGHALAEAVGLVRAGFTAGDVMSTIDSYFAWDTDRKGAFPFKPWSRWVQHDFDRWVHRAADRNDYRRAAREAARQAKLQPPASEEALKLVGGAPASTHDRRRDACSRKVDRAFAASTHPNKPAVPAPPATRPNKPAVPAMQTARMLDRSGNHELARQAVATIDTGMTAIAANPDPQTMAEALGVMDTRWREMLIKAAGTDHHADVRKARADAVATINIWWDGVPLTIRNNIDARVRVWVKDHPTAARAANNRRFQMLLPKLRCRRGLAKLGVAMRVPV